jgi:hypothetical protein
MEEDRKYCALHDRVNCNLAHPEDKPAAKDMYSERDKDKDKDTTTDKTTRGRSA